MDINQLLKIKCNKCDICSKQCRIQVRF